MSRPVMRTVAVLAGALLLPALSAAELTHAFTESYGVTSDIRDPSSPYCSIIIQDNAVIPPVYLSARANS